MIVAFTAQQLSSALYAAMPGLPRSSDAILISYIAILKDCGAERLGRMIDHFINSVALCNLGNAYFALGSNPESYVVVQMLAAVAARNVTLPVAFEADKIAFEVLVDFIGRADTNSKKTALAVRALRDLCAVPENRECAAMRGSVEALVDALMRIRNDLYSVGAARACEAALGALRFLLYCHRGRAAFASHSQSVHAMRPFIGTVSAPITDAAVLCLSTILYSFPLTYTLQCLQPHPQSNPSNFSRIGQSILSSLRKAVRGYIREHAPAEDDILSIFQ